MSKTKITRNFQITIPKDIRKSLKLKIGDKMQIHVINDKIVLEPINENVWENISDFLPENFDKIREHIRNDQTERFKKLGII
ncbi:MAG: AbrB/MazE/SpoVT family DNA-binding domain-containing protein [Promethearchaeota archaeon]